MVGVKGTKVPRSAVFKKIVIMKMEPNKGEEPWSSGLGRRLIIRRPCVRIPIIYTWRMFFILYLL